MKSIAYLMIALGVCAGAFGAHGLKDLVTPDRLEVFKTASQYQIAMSIVLLFLCKEDGKFSKVFCGLLFGIIVFSGSLYLLVLLDKPILGAITPIGGATIIYSLIAAALYSRKPSK